jgi:hypothetical protein
MRRFLLFFFLTAVFSLAVAATSVAGGARVSASPSHLNFGTVGVGGYGFLEVDFTNHSADYIQLSSVTGQGDFSLDSNYYNSCSSPYTTDPDGVCSLYVDFAPSMTGHENGKLVFHWDNGLTTTVGMGGKGSG